MRLQTSSHEQTVAVGLRLGRLLGAGQTVALFGELGAGKTTLVKGIGQALGIPQRDITSASYTIVAEYETSPPLYHIDLYRLEGESDLEAVGIYDYLGGEGISVVEWAQKMEVPEDCIKITINYLSEDEREIFIEGIDEAQWNRN